MNIVINSESRDVAEGCTVADLLEVLALTGQRLAVEVNQQIVPRSLHGQRKLSAGDRVEIVRAIGGG